MDNVFEYRSGGGTTGVQAIAGVPPTDATGNGSGGNGGGQGFNPDAPLPVTAPQVILWFFLASALMLFGGFVSAYMVRQTSGLDWTPIPLPALLWLNTAVIVLSSGVLELARRALKHGNQKAALNLTRITGLMGLAFVAGQMVVWGQFAGMGMFMPGNPHSAFFYVLSGAHALHMGGGLFGLLFTVSKLGSGEAVIKKRLRLSMMTTYWHFFGGLWLVLLGVLYLL